LESIVKLTKLVVFIPVLRFFPRTFLVTVICSPVSVSVGNLSISYFLLERNGCLRPPVILLVAKFSIDFFTYFTLGTLIYTNRKNHTWKTWLKNSMKVSDRKTWSEYNYAVISGSFLLLLNNFCLTISISPWIPKYFWNFSVVE